MSIEMTGLADIVRQHVAQRPDTAAIVHAGRTTTYAELDRASNQVANGLVAEGIAPQARVAHLDKSSDIFFELLFGAAKANAVMVSVNWRLAPPEVLHILNDAQAEILFVGEEYFSVVEKIRDELKTVRKIVAFGGRHGAWTSFAEWRDRQSAADPHLPVRSGNTAVQFYTSGTTGLPKGAQLTNAPTEVKIRFTGTVDPALSRIEVASTDGTSVDSGDTHGDADDKTMLIVSLRQLLPGTYIVRWNAVSKDTHKTQGSFNFIMKKKE